jgi:hypothetical protein
MDLSTLQAFRQDIYDCFLRAKAALFDTVDALISESQAKSFVELSLSPFFQRKWPSLYEAFEDGLINENRLQEMFIKYLPGRAVGSRWVLGIDATPIARPDSVTRSRIERHSQCTTSRMPSQRNPRRSPLDGATRLWSSCLTTQAVRPLF